MKELNLTPALANALWHMTSAGPDPSMRQMATRLRCDPSTVTFLADRLQARTLLIRDVDPHNRRTKILRLTEAGRVTRKALVAAMATRSPIAQLTGKDQRHLHDLLTAALTALPPHR